jgi:hypothetical protein
LEDVVGVFFASGGVDEEIVEIDDIEDVHGF